MNKFPALEAHRIDTASRWAIRWLVRDSGRPKPAPAALERFLERLNAERLMRGAKPPLAWDEQRRVLGFPPR